MFVKLGDSGKEPMPWRGTHKHEASCFGKEAVIDLSSGEE